MTFDEWADGRPVFEMSGREIWDAAIAVSAAPGKQGDISTCGGSSQFDALVREMLSFSAEHPESIYYLWCKNCEALLGFVTGDNADWTGTYWDKNDAGCPRCGDSATRLIYRSALLKRWHGLSNAEWRGASRLHGEASLSNDVLCGVGGKSDGGESV